MSVKVVDVPMSKFVVIGSESKQLFDGNTSSADSFGEEGVTIDMGAQYTIKGVTYLPEQNRWTSGYIHCYEVYVGDKLDHLT